MSYEIVRTSCGATSPKSCPNGKLYCIDCNDTNLYTYTRTCDSCRTEFHQNHCILGQETVQNAEKMYEEINNCVTFKTIGVDPRIFLWKNPTFNRSLIIHASEQNNASFLRCAFNVEDSNTNVHRRNAIASINAKDLFEQTAVYWAILSGNEECLKILLKNGAKISDIEKHAVKTGVYKNSNEMQNVLEDCLRERGEVENGCCVIF